METPIIKSPSDQRDYLCIALPNHLRCILISDPDTDKSAMSLTVNIGAALDPKPYHGLAHFLEHMLFMGTEKYPSENEYSQFISDHAGYTNAWTSLTQTNYSFEVGNDGFLGALDRFAQFFISPLMKQDSVDREVQAVDSEYQ